jgi:hypothetical protein
MNNLKQIGLALHNYESKHGAYPPAYTVDAEGNPLHSWRVLILPYMEQQALYDAIDLTKPWNDPANATAYNAVVETYRCPSDPTPDDERGGLTNYLTVVTPESVIRTGHSLPHANVAAPARTLLVIDVGPELATHWMSPVDLTEEQLRALDAESGPAHAGKIFLALHADGHARAMPLDSDPDLRSALSTASADDDREFQEFD